MNFFANFAQLGDAIGLLGTNSEAYSDAMARLQRARALLENGGFIGECGEHFAAYMRRDEDLLSEFMELFDTAVQTTREVLEEIQDVAEQLRSIMPG